LKSNQRMKKSIKKTLLFLLFGLFAFSIYGSAFQDDTRKKVFIVEIRDNIDPRMNRYVELALSQATALNADIIIVDMDTYGGAVNDANDIRTRLLEYEKPVWVFINNDAASAGALISIACDSIYMVPGSNIGAATVVNAQGEAAPDKYQSYMRSIMRSTAEETGRDPLIAEGMVDDRVEIEGVTVSGKIITFTSKEAIENGYSEGEVESIEDILEMNNIERYELINYEKSWDESIIAFFLNPMVSGILILVITAGIFFELQTPGVGFPLAAAGLALIFYLTPYYLNGLAANWEIAVFFVGLALIALEVFVIPGFGIAGVAGIICTVGALILVMLNNDNFNFDFVPSGDIMIASSVVLAGMVGSVLALFFFGYKFTQSKMFRRVSLQDTQDSSKGYSSNFRAESMIGAEGIAYTILRPSGRIEIADELYDAYTRGDFIEKGQKVRVISQEGSSLKVKAI